MSLTDEDVQAKMVKPGQLTRGISKAFGMHPLGSLPYHHLNLEQLPILCSKAWKKQKGDESPPVTEPLANDMQVEPILDTPPQPTKPTHLEPTPQALPNPISEGSPTQKTWGSGNNFSNQIASQRIRIKHLRNSPKGSKGDPQKNISARLLQAAEDLP